MPSQVAPVVSVIIPAYQVAGWIGDALESVTRQGFTQWEVLLVNDGSPDTPALEAAIAPYRDRITYLVQPNLGAAAARNRALVEARGEWVAFLDGDDAWEPEYLTTQLGELSARSLDMVWCNGTYIGDTPRHGTPLMTDYVCRGPVTVEALIGARVNVITSGTLVRRALIEAAGGFDEQLRRAQDFDLWVRLVQRGARAGYHRHQLIRHRLRPGSLTGDALAQVDRELTVFARIREKLTLAPHEAQALEERVTFLTSARLLILGKRALGDRDVAAARSQFAAAYRCRPTFKLGLIRGLLAVSPGLVRRLYLARTKPEYR